MESKAFHICPFCQAQNPASVSRCTRCERSLADVSPPWVGRPVSPYVNSADHEGEACLAPPAQG